MGGEWTDSKGVKHGLGLKKHYQNLYQILWPHLKHHRWADLMQEHFVKEKYIGVMGPASSSKTHEAAKFALATYYVWPDETTVLCCSTTHKMLELRVWGEIKKLHKAARQLHGEDVLPGELTQSQQRITTSNEDGNDGKDFRNGISAVACKPGGHFVGLGDYIGVKNKNVMLVADEASLMPKVFVDAVSNLNKNPRFVLIALGNPKDPNDALGTICEPVNKWDSADETEKTKTWRTRFRNGICIQLVGTDSPNFDVPEGQPVPFPFLITREKIAEDISYYTRNSLQFMMMNLGMMPKSGSYRRVITEEACEKFNATAQPIWLNNDRLKIGCADIAYGAVGGDRCIFIELQMGMDVQGRQILSMIGEHVVIPVNAKLGFPADQAASSIMAECVRRGIKPENFAYDGSGRSDFAAAAARIWSPEIIALWFGGSATERPVSADMPDRTCKEHYEKFVTELWFSPKYAIEAGQIRGMTKELIDDGCMREYGISRTKKIEIEPKEITRERMGRSPDIFDAFVVGVELARQRGFVISKLGQMNHKDGGKKWLDDLLKKSDGRRVNGQLTYK